METVWRNTLYQMGLWFLFPALLALLLVYLSVKLWWLKRQRLQVLREQAHLNHQHDAFKREIDDQQAALNRQVEEYKRGNTGQ